MRVADLVKTLKYGSFKIGCKIDNKSYDLWCSFYEDNSFYAGYGWMIDVRMGDEYKEIKNDNLIYEALKNISDFNIIRIECCDEWLDCKIKEEFLLVEEIKKIYQKLVNSND